MSPPAQVALACAGYACLLGGCLALAVARRRRSALAATYVLCAWLCLAAAWFSRGGELLTGATFALTAATVPTWFRAALATPRRGRRT